MSRQAVRGGLAAAEAGLAALAWLLWGMIQSGCGSAPSGPVGPSPAPPAAGMTLHVVETLTGTPLVELQLDGVQAPGYAWVRVPGHVERLARVPASPWTVDVIAADERWDLTLYRQLARGALVDGRLDRLRVLERAPSIYLQTAGLPDATVAALEVTARAIVPAWTGGRYHLAAWETGPEARGDADGWIVAEVVHDPAATCGLARVGEPRGHVWLSLAARCGRRGLVIDPGVWAHELGHALGYWHVDPGRYADALMVANAWREPVLSPAEAHHAAIAYQRPRGSADIDQDVDVGGTSSSPTVVLP